MCLNKHRTNDFRFIFYETFTFAHINDTGLTTLLLFFIRQHNPTTIHVSKSISSSRQLSQTQTTHRTLFPFTTQLIRIKPKTHLVADNKSESKFAHVLGEMVMNI